MNLVLIAFSKSQTTSLSVRSTTVAACPFIKHRAQGSAPRRLRAVDHSAPSLSQDTVLPPLPNTCSTAYSSRHVAACVPPESRYRCDQVSAIAISLHSQPLIQSAYAGAAFTAALCLECGESAKLHTGTEPSVNGSTRSSDDPTQILILQAGADSNQFDGRHASGHGR